MANIDIDLLYLNIAKEISTCSYAIRNKVGAVLVKDKRIISTGYNGMPSGMDNKCENSECIAIDKKECENIDQKNCTICNSTKSLKFTTKPEVVHAEANAILFAAKNGLSTKDCMLYITLSPCVECAKMIIQSGINRVIYSTEYRNIEALELLKRANITIEKYG